MTLKHGYSNKKKKKSSGKLSIYALDNKSVKIIDKVIDYLQDKNNRKFYRQGTFGSTSSINPCETECCIAGIIHYNLVGAKKHNDIVHSDICGESANVIQNLAERQLKLKNGRLADTSNLFGLGWSWDFSLGNEYTKASTQDKQAEVAIRRLEVFKLFGR